MGDGSVVRTSPFLFLSLAVHIVPAMGQPLYSLIPRTSPIEMYSIRELGRKHLVSANFELDEFACSDGSDVVLIHPRLIELAEAARRIFSDELGRETPLHTNSAYRTFCYNDRIDGHPGSRHCYGMAVDIRKVPDLPIWKMGELMSYRTDVGGIGLYDWGVHLDLGKNSRWDKRK